MVWNIFAWWFNMIERQRERALYAELHKWLYDHGMKYQLSFYGTLKEPYDGKHVQARIEVVSKDLLPEKRVHELYEHFRCVPVDREYSLYIVGLNFMIEAKCI